MTNNAHVFNCRRERKFGATAFNIKVDDFNALGFEFGDSIDLKFSNGLEYTDIPYYSGFYAHKGELILSGTQWYPDIVLVISQGDSHWDTYGLMEGTTCSVSLNTRGRYRVVQDSLSYEYTNNREDYASDVIFANFREIVGGKLKRNMFYRGASPCCDQCGRALYGEKMCRETGIRFALNLSDDVEHMERFFREHDGKLPYYKALYDEGKVIPMGMNVFYHGQEYSRDVGQGFLQMVRNE